MKRFIESELVRWKESPFKKPLLIYGARQVGKTWLMKNFGYSNFENVVYINFEKDILKKTVLLKDEDFVKSWVDKGFFFHTFKGMYDLLHQISDLNAKYQLGVPVIEEQNLIELFQEIKLPYLTIDKPGKTIFSSFSRLESTTNSILLSSELQPIKHFKMFENIILFGKSSLIESPATNRYFSEIILKNELRIQLNIDFFSSFKFVFLFIDEQG